MTTPSRQKRRRSFVGGLIPPSSRKTSATADAQTKKRHFYKPLPVRFGHNGFDYRQIYREGDFAIYQQTRKGNEHSAAFEVLRIRRRDGFQIGGRLVEPAETYPSSERWGVDGWTLPDKEAAFHKLRAAVASLDAPARIGEKKEAELP